MNEIENELKIIISGLDFAGKTSILTALDKKFEFRQEIMELKPTIRVNYSSTSFLNLTIFTWDMGGQEKYRELYLQKEDVYFGDTDLIIYVIDIQDPSRFEVSLDYLDSIMNYFKKNEIDIPMILSFHKYDPELRGDEGIIENINALKSKILEKYPTFKILFQMTSIYDIFSIIQLISYALSVFNEKFFELSELFEKYLLELDCTSLILFDRSGIIISEYYSDDIDSTLYVELLETIKEHLFLLKRMQEEKYVSDYNFFTIEDKLLSYLHRLKMDHQIFFVSVVIKEILKEKLLEKFSDFLEDLTKVFTQLLD